MNFLTIFLVCLAITSATTKMTFISTAAQPNPVSMANMACLKAAGYLNQTFVEGYQWPNLTWWLTSDPVQIKNTLNLETNIVFKPYLYAKDSVDFTTDLYAKWLNGLPLKSAWLNVPDLQDDITCQYATSFAILLSKKLKIKFGIYASSATWGQKFEKGCNTMSSLPLFAFPITAQYYRPFAGWTKYEFTGSDNGYQYNLCNTYTLYGIQSQ